MVDLKLQQTASAGKTLTRRKPPPTGTTGSQGNSRLSSSFSTKIIKAGALLADTKILLAHWDESSSLTENLTRLRRDNPFGKTSRSRIEDILPIFRERYLASDDKLRALIRLARDLPPGKTLDRILFFHAVESDPLLRAVVLDFIWPLHAAGKHSVTVNALVEKLLGYSREGRTSVKWREETARRVAQGILSLLRDFGLLEGVVRKSIVSPFLPAEAFAYVAFLLSRPPWALSGPRLLATEEWRVFLLGPEAVERGLLEAHQAGLLQFQAAGSIVRIQFPSDSAEAYACLLAQRSH